MKNATCVKIMSLSILLAFSHNVPNAFAERTGPKDIARPRIEVDREGKLKGTNVLRDRDGKPIDREAIVDYPNGIMPRANKGPGELDLKAAERKTNIFRAVGTDGASAEGSIDRATEQRNAGERRQSNSPVENMGDATALLPGMGHENGRFEQVIESKDTTGRPRTTGAEKDGKETDLLALAGYTADANQTAEQKLLADIQQGAREWRANHGASSETNGKDIVDKVKEAAAKSPKCKGNSCRVTLAKMLEDPDLTEGDLADELARIEGEKGDGEGAFSEAANEGEALVEAEFAEIRQQVRDEVAQKLKDMKAKGEIPKSNDAESKLARQNLTNKLLRARLAEILKEKFLNEGMDEAKAKRQAEEEAQRLACRCMRRYFQTVCALEKTMAIVGHTVGVLR